ncbi:GGDEF domain-containing protein [Oceanispirochaeta crateris]|nr:GGDEF domain-containing protein [Oceanispirochaeta crateris]
MNTLFLTMGITDDIDLERIIVFSEVFLQLLIFLLYWRKLANLAKSSVILWIAHLCCSIFVLQPENLVFQFYFIAIPPFLGYIDDYKNSYSRILSLISLLLYNVAIAYQTVSDIHAGVSPKIAIVGYFNQFVVGIVLISVFLLHFKINRSSLKKATEESTLDPLTNALNRRAMEVDLQIFHKNHRGKGTYLMMMDLDHFKSLNDLFGHQVGDLILKGLVNIVNRTVRSGDRLYRYGGEEFLLITQDVDEAQVLQIAEKIRENICLHSWEVLKGKGVTCSFGLAPLLNDFPIRDSIELADRALYRAKSEGRNRVCLETPSTVEGQLSSESVINKKDSAFTES